MCVMEKKVFIPAVKKSRSSHVPLSYTKQNASGMNPALKKQ